MNTSTAILPACDSHCSCLLSLTSPTLLTLPTLSIIFCFIYKKTLHKFFKHSIGKSCGKVMVSMWLVTLINTSSCLCLSSLSHSLSPLFDLEHNFLAFNFSFLPIFWFLSNFDLIIYACVSRWSFLFVASVVFVNCHLGTCFDFIFTNYVLPLTSSDYFAQLPSLLFVDYTWICNT